MRPYNRFPDKHPPLGVNAITAAALYAAGYTIRFQWAHTLGGECYETYYPDDWIRIEDAVSMGTHPWG